MAKNSTKTKEIDVTKTGPQSYRDLQKANEAAFSSAASESVFTDIQSPKGYVQPSDVIYEGGEYSPIYTQSQGEDTYGSSIFDESYVNEEDFQNLSDVRANNQPWYAQIGAGLAKGAILAGTTFLDGTLGLIFGAGTAINEGRWSGLWDNDFSKAMQSVNEWSEKALPNYYTKAEQEQPWYDNIFTANFLGDKFIKNLGFTVGAFYSGGVTAAGLKATKLPQLIGAIAKSSKAPAIVNSAVGATISAVNEGRIEALNNSNDWFQLHKQQIDDQYAQRIQAIEDQYAGTEMYNQLMAAERDNYNQAIGRLNEDRLKMGNADLLMNIPVLMASNIIQFGKLYANGFKTTRKATNIVGKAGEYTAGTTRLGSTLAVTRGALSEGAEEMAQGAASRIAGNYYSTDVNNFYKSKTDPDAAQETLSWTKSFAEGINETVNDGSTWEEFMIGTLTGALGMPHFRSARTADGRFQSPITIEGGAFNELREYNKKMVRENEIANYLNSRVNSPEFKNYYQGLIRHNKYQNDMNQAAEQGDEFNFKNAEHAQLVSDIAMFDNAGKIEDLYTLIDAAYDTSDENLASIVENTTTTLEDGSKVGPFVDKNGNPMYATPEGKQEMINKLTENRDEMTKTIDNYLKIKDDLDIKTGQQLSDDQLEELTWMKSQIGNWSDRATAMSGDVKSAIGSILGNLDSFLRFNEQIRDYEGRTHADLTDRYKTADANVRAIQGAINTLNLVRNQDDKTLAYTLATNPKFADGLVKEINEVDESVLSEDEKQDITTKLNDIVRLGNASKIYNAKLKEYLENPQKQAEDHARADEQAAQRETKKKSDDLKTPLSSATTLKDFRAIVDIQDNIENRDKVLKELEDDGNAMAKNYRETSQYNTEVSRLIQASDADPQTKQDAMKLLQDQFSNSDDLNQLANPNSIYVNNENAFDDESEGDAELSATRFQNAQYELQRAMSKVNNDNKFKDRFSAEYKKPVDKREGTVKGDDRKDTTGDSGTATIPSVGTSNLPETTEAPVGNITQEMVAEENKKANERVEMPQRPQRGETRQYYRPAIPELHIEASKEGDFRPFDAVVSEREQGVDFSGIYGYLRDSGAFRYVDEGNLKAGDELGFMIDPDFNDHTIFLIDKRNGQIVGSLDESDYSVSRYEGLKNLGDRIRKEFANRENKTGRFIATPTTKVSKMMVGRIPYGDTEKNLKDIPNVSGEGRAPVFGIIKNGTLTTNGKVDDSLIIKPVDMAQKEGRLYLLIPNGAGKYSPAAVRVKHFNNEEFNLDDVNVANTPIGKDISAAINKLATATSQDDVSQAMQDLAQDLYMQDIMVTWFDGRAGSGIVISKKVRKPDGTYEKVVIDGKEQIKEDKYDVYFSTSKKSAVVGGIEYDVTALEDLGDTSALGVPKDPNDIYKEILGYLVKFNLPLQVGTKRINNGSYNNRLINSGILTSNITDASVRSTWFTTDYFDNEGNLHQAISPASVTPQPKRKVETPVGGTEGAIAGTEITSVFSNKTYHVDLKTNTIRDGQGNNVPITNDNRILLDLAWAQDNFGSSTSSTVMVDNKVLTPSGRVLDRTAQKYLTGQEEQDVKDAIAGRKKQREDRVAKSKEVINEIYENQKRVDKARTDGEFYYVLEDDGQYHEYSRVHSRLGSNWIESPKQKKALDLIKLNLSKFVDNPSKYKSYIDDLERKYKIDLSEYKERADVKSREAIVNRVRDLMSGTNSQRALDAGSAVDSVIRQYFTIRDVSKIVKPDNMTEQAYVDLITNLNKIKSNMEQMGERFLADNIVLFQKYPDGTRVAGEVDILSVDKDGNFRIYDVKTSGYSFYDFTDRYGHKVNYFTTPSAAQRMSSKDYYTLQLSAYKNLFESQYSVPVVKLAVMPFVLSYDKNRVSRVQSEKGIPITYNPAVNVPLVSAVKVDRPAVSQTNAAELNKNEPKSLDERIAINSSLDGNGSTDVFGKKGSKVWMKQKDGRPQGKKNSGNVVFYETDGMQQIALEVPHSARAGAINVTTWRLLTEDEKSMVEQLLMDNFMNRKTNLSFSEVASAVDAILHGNNPESGPESTQQPSTVAQEQQVLPIFETSLETQNPIEDLTPEHSMNNADEGVGYFEIDGKLHKGYVTPITVVDGIEVHLTKVPNITKGFGNDAAHVASNSYYAVFPNGKTFLALKNNPVQGGFSQSQVEQSVRKMLENNPQRVKDMSNEKTILFDPNAAPTINATPVVIPETPATINQSIPQSGAAYTAQKEQAVKPHDEEFEDEFTLRRVTTTEAPVWNQEQELNWLRRVLPQLSESDRVKVVKGLIKVGRQGTLAWGQFDNGVITLSDIAAEGTTYHEAFHAVFNLLLDQSERQALYDEARRIYGEKDNLSLEEDMAEGFREYVMTRQNRGLGRKILDFFKELFAKVTHWNNFRPSLTSYYQRINVGKYADSSFKVPTISELRGAAPNTTTFNSLSETVRENLTKKGWTEEKFNSISQEERDHALRCIAF